MLKTFLIACTLMMAGSVYAEGGAVATGLAEAGSTACVKSNNDGKTNCGSGDNIPSQ